MQRFRPGDTIIFKDYNGKTRTGRVKGICLDIEPAHLVLDQVAGDPKHKVITPDQVIRIKRESFKQQGLFRL